MAGYAPYESAVAVATHVSTSWRLQLYAMPRHFRPFHKTAQAFSLIRYESISGERGRSWASQCTLSHQHNSILGNSRSGSALT